MGISKMTLCYTRITFLDASDARKFYCLEIVAPATAGVAGALPPAMTYMHVMINLGDTSSSIEIISTNG